MGPETPFLSSPSSSGRADRLSAPLVLTSENSGLLFVATGAVAISGGVAVGPWTATTAAQTAGLTAGLVTAKLPAPASFGGTRQLFVNGLRSPRVSTAR